MEFKKVFNYLTIYSSSLVYQHGCSIVFGKQFAFVFSFDLSEIPTVVNHVRYFFDKYIPHSLFAHTHSFCLTPSK